MNVNFINVFMSGIFCVTLSVFV